MYRLRTDGAFTHRPFRVVVHMFSASHNSPWIFTTNFHTPACTLSAASPSTTRARLYHPLPLNTPHQHTILHHRYDHTLKRTGANQRQSTKERQQPTYTIMLCVYTSASNLNPRYSSLLSLPSLLLSLLLALISLISLPPSLSSLISLSPSGSAVSAERTNKAVAAAMAAAAAEEEEDEEETEEDEEEEDEEEE